MSDWKELNDVELNSSTDIISCDTRDFHVIVHNDSDVSFVDNVIRKIQKHDLNSYLIKRDEIITFLKGLKLEFYKQPYHYMLSFNVPDNIRHYRGWFKYIRFARYKDDKYLIYTTSGEDMYPLSQMIVNPENIII